MLCLTGPESTGKTTLAQTLATKFDLPLVTEVARSWLGADQGYDEADLALIGQAQHQAEVRAGAARNVVIADTDVLVIAVWWRHRFARSRLQPWPAWLHRLLQMRTLRHYLLCLPDLPWEPDPLRESPYQRHVLLDSYLALLRSGPFSWQAISGTGAQRTEAGRQAAEAYLARKAKRSSASSR